MESEYRHPSGSSAVKQIDGNELHEVASELVAQFASIRISRITWEMNVDADRLVNAGPCRVLTTQPMKPATQDRPLPMPGATPAEYPPKEIDVGGGRCAIEFV
jgi:hypothetical protein